MRTFLPKKIALFLLLAVFTIACSGSPKWIISQGAAFEDSGISALYGVGMARKSNNLSLARQKAEARARTELAKQIQTWSSSFIKDFASEHKDFMAQDGGESSTEFYESVAKNVAEATLNGSMIIDSYDADDGYWYSLAKLPLDNRFMQSYKAKTETLLRESQSEALKSKADAMLLELDKELQKRTAQQTPAP